MKHIKELDGIRAIAILLVIIGHWSIEGSLVQKVFNADFGVNIFFVLSGFLITWILFSARETAKNAGSGLGRTFGNFYIRRTLRIFPIYYLCVLFLYFFPGGLVEDKAHIFPWLFTYTTNLFFFIYQKWDGHISHLWSLAVEEQFYLVWPACMLFAGKKYLRLIIYAFIVLGIGFQLFFRGLPMINYFTISCFSAFGIGALLAYYLVYQPESLPRFERLLRIPAVISLMLYIVGIFQHRWPSMPMQRVFHSILAVYGIAYVLVHSQAPSRVMMVFLRTRVLVFIGKISYGLYLYHGILPFLLSYWCLKWFGFKPEESLSLLQWIILKGVVVLFASWLSWVLIEKPVLRLKKYFEYAENKGESLTQKFGVSELEKRAIKF